MEKMNKSKWMTLGVLGALIGTAVSFWAFQALTNNSSSGGIISQTAFGEHTMQESTITDEEMYNDDPLPEFLNDLDLEDYVEYGDQYIVGHNIEGNFLYDGMARYYDEFTLSIFSSTGVDIWSYTFELSEAFAKADALGDYYDTISIHHMVLEDNTLFLIVQITHRITYYDWEADADLTVDSGDTFRQLGTLEESKNFLQSFVRFNIEEKSFHVLGVNESDTEIFNSEDITRIEPYRYALAQEFNKDNDEAFTHVYFGETLTFTEYTHSIALLTEVTFHPTLFTVTNQTIGKWSTSSSIDIDIEGIVNTKQEYFTVEESGMFEVNVDLEINTENEFEDRANNFLTAEDDILTSAQQTLIEDASELFAEDENMELLEYKIYAVMDEDFNVISKDLVTNERSIIDNYDYTYVSIYWIEDNRFVYIYQDSEFNDDGVLIRGDATIQFKTGNTVTKTFSLEGYGEIDVYEFFMDDAGTIILAGEFGSNDDNAIVDYDRTFVLFLNKDFQVLDDFIIDGEGASNYLNVMYVDEDQIRVYVGVGDHTGLFENIDINIWKVVFTIALI
jgi:hypothetical protein